MKNQEELLIHLWNKIESDFESIERKLDRKIKIKKAGLKSFCQEKRNFNELQISATQADTQNILGGFWVK